MVPRANQIKCPYAPFRLRDFGGVR
jgi:hypothetical protein